MRGFPALPALTLALIFSRAEAGTAPAGAPPPPTPPPAVRYQVEILAEGMPQPMELELAPDGRVFFIEIGGKLRLWKPDTGAVVDAGQVKVFTALENGLLGFALDPHFSENHWIYLLYSPADFEGQHLSRFVMNGDTLDLASEKVILTYPEQRRECCHHAGSVEFAPDGCLIFSTGDNTHPAGDSDGYAPIDDRQGREPWDAQKSAANPNDLRGKIIRIRPKADGTYEIPPGNLFPPGTAGTRPEIYCMGCRNPWRMSVDSATGIVYWGEVGPDAGGDNPRGPRGYDEINQAKKAGNHGWPFFIGNNFPYARFDHATSTTGTIHDPARPVNSGVNNTGRPDLPPAVPAMIYYPYGASKEFPEMGQGGRTACAGPVFHYQPGFEKTGGFPACYDNCLLWWDWERRVIKWARLDKDANFQGIEPFVAELPCKRMLDAVFAPDGQLYCLDYGETWGANPDSKLMRVSFNHGNLPPRAAVSASVTSGPVPLKVKFSAAGSTDPDGDATALKYEWRKAGSPEILSTEASPEIEFKEPGDVIIELRARDAAGGAGVTTAAVTAGNTPPVVKLESPVSGDFFSPGKPVAWRASVSDAEEGNSTDSPDSFSPRLLISALPDRGGETAPGLALMKSADCFNCHAVDQKVVGPALLDIAAKYRSVAGALEASTDRVQKGSTGVWGPLPMLPHGHHSRDQIRQMVSWVFGLQPGSEKPQLLRGLTGEVTPPEGGGAGRAKGFVIDATFSDAGNAPAGPLSGKAGVTLRNRRVEAEDHDGLNGSRVLGGGSAGGGKFVGATDDGHTLRLAALNLEHSSKITCRTASAGQGGWIELHAASPGGPLLAKVEVPVTGGWETWQEGSAPLTIPGPARGDVFLVFKNPGKGGLMNLDWIRFDP
ncbi:MAG: PQQ-dependent sugar dehydrogenase [Verrucomicrobiota bacterium]